MTPRSPLFLGTDDTVFRCAKNFLMELAMFWVRVRASGSSDSADEITKLLPEGKGLPALI